MGQKYVYLLHTLSAGSKTIIQDMDWYNTFSVTGEHLSICIHSISCTACICSKESILKNQAICICNVSSIVYPS